MKKYNEKKKKKSEIFGLRSENDEKKRLVFDTYSCSLVIEYRREEHTQKMAIEVGQFLTVIFTRIRESFE